MSAIIEPFEIIIDAGQAGERMDRAVVASGAGVSRAILQRWMAEGRVTAEGRALLPKDKAKAGMVVRIQPAPPPVSEAEPEDIPLHVLYEDAHLLVLDKPAGLVVHPAPGHASGTLVNALLHHTQIAQGGDPLRPGVVHRLDKDTSGIMVVARTARAHEGLGALFSSHSIERVYEAICVGAAPQQATYAGLIGRHPTDRKRFSSCVARGKHAVTHLTKLRDLHGASLVRCQLETGRTHQIRVHLSDHGLPLLGDPVYGRRPADERVKAAASRLGRQALHARVLGFRHPITGERLRFETPPPADFVLALAALSD